MKAINEGDLDGKTPHDEDCRKTGCPQPVHINYCPKLSCGKTSVELHTADLIAVTCVSVSAKLPMVHDRTEKLYSLSSGESFCG